jgi:transketolase
MAYGELGPTHHSIEDLSWLRAIAGLGIVVPADPAETRSAVRWAAAAATPVFLRVGRFKVPAVTGGHPFSFGVASRLRDGSDVTVVATGTMVSRALAAAGEAAAEGVTVRVLNMSTIAPLDEAAIRRAARETGAIVTVEEATTTGGLGAAVAAIVVTEPAPVPMRILGVPRAFAPTGSADFLLEHFGLTAADIRAAVMSVARSHA